MCFYIHPDFKEVRVAKEKIECFKILRYNLRSPYYKFQYVLNKRYRLRKKLEVLYYGLCIEKGFHSYSKKSKARNRCLNHSVIVRCVIPRGAKYYYNPDLHEYVSTQIKLKEIINY